MLINKGIIDTNNVTITEEISNDQRHYWRFDLITTDGTEIRYDVEKGQQDWGLLFFFSDSIGGAAIGRYVRVTHQTDIKLVVENNKMTVYKVEDKIDELFDILPGKTYYINVVNRQQETNTYYLMIGDGTPLSEILC